MTDHQKFKALLNQAGLTREDFADKMGMKYTSMTNQLAPSKELPKWAKSAIIIVEKLKDKELLK